MKKIIATAIFTLSSLLTVSPVLAKNHRLAQPKPITAPAFLPNHNTQPLPLPEPPVIPLPQPSPIPIPSPHPSPSPVPSPTPSPHPTPSPVPTPTPYPSPVPTIIPFWCGNQSAQARPGSPVHLNGTGIACAYGFGKTSFKIRWGGAYLRGRGMVAVKGGNISADGWDYQHQFGNWTVYFGRGSIFARGSNIKVVSYFEPRGYTRAYGTGKASYHGYWNIHYGHLFTRATDDPQPVELPEEVLKLAPQSALQISQ